MKILVTGIAGFIGFFLTKRLLKTQHEIIGVDNINDYYDPLLKLGRLKELGFDTENIEYDKKIQSRVYKNLYFIKLNVEDRKTVNTLFDQHNFDYIFHLAAQAGVRYSIENPYVYIDSNIQGFINILEGVRKGKTKHLIYASSSSVYGANKKLPFSEADRTDHPISLYAATKRANELMAYNYSYLFNIPATGLRFFTVYGPFGRPDMAYFKFTHSIFENKAIDVYNYGNMKRDFTYIDDIVEGLVRIMYKIPAHNVSQPPHRIFNIGNNNPVDLMYFISLLEKYIGKKAKINLLPLQPGDLIETFADISLLEKEIGFRPVTSIEEGLESFVDWYKSWFYKV